MGEPSLDDSNVKVAVRVRPMNRRGERKRLQSAQILDYCSYTYSHLSQDVTDSYSPLSKHPVCVHKPQKCPPNKKIIILEPF